MSKNSMRRATNAGLILVALALITSWPAWAQRPSVPPRTFPQFVGTWVLDEAASTGTLNIVPRIPLRFTVAITSTEIIVTKRPRLQRGDNASDSPPPEVYRLDGTETDVPSSQVTFERERTRRFTLVADMLALTTIERYPARGKAFTGVTDALAVEGDVVTLHRQLTSVNASGEILTMQGPNGGNFRQTFIYRRAQP